LYIGLSFGSQPFFILNVNDPSWGVIDTEMPRIYYHLYIKETIGR
jgi:hypothetical protein